MNWIEALKDGVISDSIYYDSVNGEAGIDWLIGTPKHPVNNLPDLRAILVARNLKTVVVLSDITLDAAMPYTFIGQNPISAVMVDINSQDISEAAFVKLHITGTQAALGGTLPIFFNCVLDTVTNFQGYAVNCIIWDLSQGGEDNYYLDCYFNSDFDTNGHWAHIQRGSGDITFSGITAGEVMIRGFQGAITLDETCTAGNIQLHGDILLNNNDGSDTIVWDFRTSGFTNTRFYQETAAATDVDGTTWKDLLDMGLLALYSPVRICGFKVTKAGTWAGTTKIRIVNGLGDKIFPFQDEYVEGVDFTSGVLAVLSFPIEVSASKGYKLQFRSSNAGDGAGETLELNNLDVMELS